MLKITKYLILLVNLAWIASIDYQRKQITNQSIRILLGIRVIWAFLEMTLCKNNWKGELLQAAVSFFVIGSLLFVFYFLSRKAIGAGDVKLLAVVGLYCGFEQTLMIAFFAAIYAMAAGIFTRKKTEIPFALYIFCGTLSVLLQEWLKAW